ncbi:hypothetical protein [Pseudomonas aeruginosa]|uniref:hypothetical protein n=1 Tax=Pseudomonas aeruginosa TaxID=287 RepID=UPI003D80A5A5
MGSSTSQASPNRNPPDSGGRRLPSASARPANAGLALAEGSLRPPLSGGFLFGLAWLVLLPTFGGYGLYWLGLRHLSAQGGSAALYLARR